MVPFPDAWPGPSIVITGLILLFSLTKGAAPRLSNVLKNLKTSQNTFITFY